MVVSKWEVGDTIVSGRDVDPMVHYLQAIIDAVIVEKVGKVLSNKGSTNKKVNIRSYQGREAEINFFVSASGTLESIKVDKKVSLAVANQLKGVIGELPNWIRSNVLVQYTVKVGLR